MTLQIGVSCVCVFTAEQWIESGLAALLFATFALWVGLIAHFLLHGEPLTPRTATAALLGVAGVGVGVIGTLTFVGTRWWVPGVPAAVVGSFPLVNTLLAVLWGNLLANEKLSGRVFVGGALILAGVVLVIRASPARKAPAGPGAAESVKLR